MKFKVIAVSYVEAPDWRTAETAVEQNLVMPTEITSQPALDTPEDYIEYGINKKILKDQADLYFKDMLYEQAVSKLKEKASVWLINLLEKCFKTNEENWK
jgi:hypothetical protein